MSIFAIIPPALALEIAPFESTEETRYYLNGFAIDKTGLDAEQGVNLIATDGHACVIMHAPEGMLSSDGDQNDPRLPIVKLSKSFRTTIKAKMKEKGQDALSLVIDGTPGQSSATLLWGVDGTEGSDHIKEILTLGAKSSAWLAAEGGVLIDGTYPDYSRTFPSGGFSGEPVTQMYDSTLISKFGKLSPARSQAVIMHATESSGPAWVAVAGRKDVVGVIMPMRGSPEEGLNPALTALVGK